MFCPVTQFVLQISHMEFTCMSSFSILLKYTSCFIQKLFFMLKNDAIMKS